MDNKAELVIMALQQRIGELVSNYETQVAVLRAEITQYSQEKEEKEKAVEEYSKSLEEKTSKQKST
jgi:flagellar biosynthesis chaperone FliJ